MEQSTLGDGPERHGVETGQRPSRGESGQAPPVSPMGGGVQANVENLYRCAKRVAKTHNGKHFTRRAQIDAIVQLQLLIEQIENQDPATTAPELAFLELPPSGQPLSE